MLRYLEILKGYSDNIMFRTVHGESMEQRTFIDYCTDMEHYAFALDKILGDPKGKHVGIISRSGYEYLVLLGAIIFSRAVAVPINDMERKENIAFAINNAELDLLIVSSEEDEFEQYGLIVKKQDDLFDGFEGRKALSDFTEEERHEPALIIYTSGTTSLSKGVVLSADSLFHDKRYILPKAYLEKKEDPVGAIAYTNFPFYHVGGMLVWVSWPVMGCTICLSSDPRNILEDLAHHDIDIGAVIPATFKLWITCIKKGRKDRIGHVRHILSGGAPLDTEQVNLFIKNGISVGQFYGQTEVGGSVTVNLDMENHARSVGRAVDNAEVFIDDGEICIKHWGNMLGYYKNAEETASTMKDGVIYTGDLGHIDKDGYVYIPGRKNNLIILSGGENISPEELETLIYKNELIKECKVYEKNDRIAADIFAPDADEETLREYIYSLNEKMPIYKRIYTVNIRKTEIEKTASGKIKR
jgi:long-chain acyl-CoA synthetase